MIYIVLQCLIRLLTHAGKEQMVAVTVVGTHLEI